MSETGAKKTSTPRKNRILTYPPEEYWWFKRLTKAEQQSLLDLASSRRTADLKLCLDWLLNCLIRWSTQSPKNLAFTLNLADRLIPDENEDIRWGTLCSLITLTKDHPEELWPLIIKWGSVYNPDIRSGVGCCLLEHVLDYHFEEYFPRCQAEIESGNKYFDFTLKSCHKLGRAKLPENARLFDEYVGGLKTRGRK